MNAATVKIKYVLFATLYIVLASLVMTSIARMSWVADVEFGIKGPNSERNVMVFSLGQVSMNRIDYMA